MSLLALWGVKENTNGHSYRHGKSWSDSDKKFLKDNYKKIPHSEIMDKLNRSSGSVYEMMRVMGLRLNEVFAGREKRGKQWLDREVDYLIENYESLGVDKIAIDLGRTKLSVYQKAYRLKDEGLIDNKKTNGWNGSDINFLKNNYKKMSVDDIANKLNKSVRSIYCKAQYIGLKKKG